MEWITDHIAIGNFLDAQSLPGQIDAVLCLLDCCAERTDVNALSVPLHDGPGNRCRDLAEALQFLDETTRSGERVLVHCHAGRSRSVIVVARWLMRSRGLTPTAALEYIAQRREVHLSPGIEDLLSAPLP